MGGVSVTLSLRMDEVEKIKEFMERYDMTRHEVIKFCLRRSLFPGEAKVPLNHRHVHFGETEAGHKVMVVSPAAGTFDIVDTPYSKEKREEEAKKKAEEERKRKAKAEYDFIFGKGSQ